MKKTRRFYALLLFGIFSVLACKAVQPSAPHMPQRHPGIYAAFWEEDDHHHQAVMDLLQKPFSPHTA